MPELAWCAWLLLAVAALTVGISKTAVPGASTVAVAIFAAILPAKQSTGALLVLLIVADLFAVTAYRRHANWRVLLRLAPAVLVGLLLGVLFLAVADDVWVRKVIGVILLVVIAITLVRRRMGRTVAGGGSHRVAAATYGTLGGFTTMVANAGGPVMSMYFLASRFSVKEFLGTAAWFFALVNITKVPFSVGLGLITVPGLLLDLVLVPVVVGRSALRPLVRPPPRPGALRATRDRVHGGRSAATCCSPDAPPERCLVRGHARVESRRPRGPSATLAPMSAPGTVVKRTATWRTWVAAAVWAAIAIALITLYLLVMKLFGFSLALALHGTVTAAEQVPIFWGFVAVAIGMSIAVVAAIVARRWVALVFAILLVGRGGVLRGRPVEQCPSRDRPRRARRPRTASVPVHERRRLRLPWRLSQGAGPLRRRYPLQRCGRRNGLGGCGDLRRTCAPGPRLSRARQQRGRAGPEAEPLGGSELVGGVDVATQGGGIRNRQRHAAEFDVPGERPVAERRLPIDPGPRGHECASRCPPRRRRRPDRTRRRRRARRRDRPGAAPEHRRAAPRAASPPPPRRRARRRRRGPRRPRPSTNRRPGMSAAWSTSPPSSVTTTTRATAAHAAAAAIVSSAIARASATRSTPAQRAATCRGRTA